MGAGKSTIGRLLAKELRLPFKDSDKEIEQRTGADIPWIFDVEGEQGFRDREQAMIEELCGHDGVVLATGGGAVLRPANRRALRDGGRVVYLHTSVEQQIERTSRDRNRPLLRSADPLVKRMLAAKRIRPDALRLGLDIDRDGHVVDARGRASDHILAIGPMTRGDLWEVVAVPDIRVQVSALARRLVNAHWTGGEGL